MFELLIPEYAIGSMQRYSVRLSVRLSDPSIDRFSSVRRVAAVGPADMRYRSTAAAVMRCSSTAHNSKCEQCHVVS